MSHATPSERSDQTRPPILLRPSRTVTVAPASLRSRAAFSPLNPAPITMTEGFCTAIHSPAAANSTVARNALIFVRN